MGGKEVGKKEIKKGGLGEEEEVPLLYAHCMISGFPLSPLPCIVVIQERERRGETRCLAGFSSSSSSSSSCLRRLLTGHIGRAALQTHRKSSIEPAIV